MSWSFLSRSPLGRQRFALGLFAEGQKQKSHEESQNRQRYGRARSFKVANPRADKKSESRRREAADVGGECKRAGAAFGPVLCA
jgi:hypothetical protein